MSGDGLRNKVIQDRIPANIENENRKLLKHDRIRKQDMVVSKQRRPLRPYPIFSNVTTISREVAPEKWVKTDTGTKQSTKHLNQIAKTKNPRQFVIDAGQKMFGANQCRMCGMVFSANDPEDEQCHSSYHRQFLGAMKFSGWKSERIVDTYIDGRIIKITAADSQFARKKVADVLSVTEVDLSCVTTSSVMSDSHVTYLFISIDEKITGCLMAEQITHAFMLRVMENSCQVNSSLCMPGSESLPAFCGISRIWTYLPMRRNRIASRLVDALRKSFIIGMQLEHDQIALSDPTPDGQLFAMKYFKTSNILIYNVSQ